MLHKSKKEEIIKGLEKTASDSKSVLFLNFHGMNVTNETTLRRELRSKGVGYKVARKTLLKRAFSGKATGDMPELPGEVAIAFSEDSIAPAREVFTFSKAHQNILNILGGVFEGKFQNSAFMMELATIPSREVLLSKIAFLFNSPIQRLAIAMSEVAKGK